MRSSSSKPVILALQFYCYPDEIGGAWKYTYEVNKRLVRRGYTVVLLTCKPDPGMPDYEVIDGIHYFRVGARESKGVVSLWRGIRKRLREIFLRFDNIELVHVHNPLVEFLALAGGGLAWCIPRVYHFYSSWLDEERINRVAAQPSAERGRAAFRLELFVVLAGIRLMEWVCFATAKSVLFLSHYSAEQFRALFPWSKRRLTVIPGGVDVEEFHPVSAEVVAADRSALGLPGDRPVLLTVRRLAARMGLDNLVRAAALLAQRAPQLPFFLVIVGHGVLEAELRALIVELGVGDRVRMFGRLAPEPLAACYRCADVFVLPTTQIEGFGLATVEALASGIPVLGTPVGGTVEILQGIDSRLLFADVSPEAMADKIETFLRDPSPFLRLKPQCRETAVALYGWESVVDRIERELAWALSPRRDGG